MSEARDAAGWIEPPPIPGEALAALPTPSLVVDLTACERNIARAAEHFAGVDAVLRPHFKAHKCTELLGRQLAAGSCRGVTCATAAEAAVLARAGHDDILVANQVIDPTALALLVRAAGQAGVTVAVDALEHVEALAGRARAAGVEIAILIEVDVGMGRCGIPAGSGALLELADAVAASGPLRLRGLQGYEGHAVLLPDRAERRGHVARAAEILAAERQRLVEAGHACEIVSGGGTGTYDLASEAGVLDEVQAGSYVLMDGRYATLGLPFENALFLAATVISRPERGRAVLDAGLKAQTAEYGLPRCTRPGMEVLGLSDEHALVALAEGAELRVGETVPIVPAHIDPTINLHDVLFAWNGVDEAFEQWPVDARRSGREEAAVAAEGPA